MENKKRIDWPRIKDLPQEHQKPFNKWLDDYGQTRPWIDDLPPNEQDGYFPWDYERWCEYGRRKKENT